MFKLNLGLFKNLPSLKNKGYLYFTSDTKELFVDISETERIKVGDIVRVQQEADLPSLTAVEDGRIYYVKENKKLVIYSQEKGFVSINDLSSFGVTLTATEINQLKQDIDSILTKIESGELGGGGGGVDFKYNSNAYNTPGLIGGTANWVDFSSVTEGQLRQLSDVSSFDPGVSNENIGNFTLSDLNNYSTEIVFLDRGSTGTILDKPTTAPKMVTIPTKHYTTWLKNAIGNDIKNGLIDIGETGGGTSGPLTWGQLKGLTTTAE